MLSLLISFQTCYTLYTGKKYIYGNRLNAGLKTINLSAGFEITESSESGSALQLEQERPDDVGHHGEPDRHQRGDQLLLPGLLGPDQGLLHQLRYCPVCHVRGLLLHDVV